MLDGAVGGDAAKGGAKLMFHRHQESSLQREVDGGRVCVRPAAAGSRWRYAKRMEEIGFFRGRSASTVFWHPESGVRMVVWGDVFTILGRQEDLRNLAESLAEWY